MWLSSQPHEDKSENFCKYAMKIIEARSAMESIDAGRFYVITIPQKETTTCEKRRENWDAAVGTYGSDTVTSYWC